LIGGATVDPITVTLYIGDPTGTVTTVAMGDLTHVSVGVWTYNINADISGDWTYKFQGTGNVEVTSPDIAFTVRASKVIAG
jgi:hypothetical protein